jgi:hypothetical protein
MSYERPTWLPLPVSIEPLFQEFLAGFVKPHTASFFVFAGKKYEERVHDRQLGNS